MLNNDPISTWVAPDIAPQQQFVRAHEEFQRRLQAAWPSQEAEQAVSNAFAEYSAILEKPWQSIELKKSLAEAYQACRKRIHEAFADGNATAVIEAYRDYVRNLKNIWAELDPESFAPEELGAIAQGIAWVANVAFEVSAAHPPTTQPRS
jgi:hypothetical protein